MVAEKEYAPLDGNYTYVGFDIDATGRRLVDEIFHIAAYTPNDEFSQYIMPLMNLNPGARSRHQIRVITVGFFRMLKSMQSYKVIKTKTEIAAIMEFLQWLEKVNEGRDGIVFLYHEQNKLAPYMLIEAMKKYNLFERFDKIVKAFVNGYELNSENQKAKGLKYLNLWQMYKVFSEELKRNVNDNDRPFEGDAATRAKLSYDICKMIAYEGEDKEELDDKEKYQLIDSFIKSKARPIDRELDELVEMEESIDRQTGMRDIFVTYFSTSRYHRRRALNFRRALAEAMHNKDTLQQLWESGKREAIENLVKDLESIKEEDREELINILDYHFDPDKKPFKPVVNNPRRDSNGMGRNSMRRRQSQNGPRMNKENRGPRSDSRRRRRNSNKRRVGNGNIGHEKDDLYKDQQQPHTPNMVAVN